MIMALVKVIRLIESWFIELAKALGKFFLSPLFYWFILLGVIAGYRRIQKERYNFGFKIFDIFAEFKNTWLFSLITGLVISLITLSVGFVFSYEVVLLLSIVIILLSIHFKFSLLSASYTIGITYILLLLAPIVFEQYTEGLSHLFHESYLVSLAILLGLFLFIEALLIRRVDRNDTFPSLACSQRGAWIGTHQLKKLAMIPFFVLIPTGSIEPFAHFWPYFSYGGETYSLLIVPFLIGFDYSVRGTLANQAAKHLAKSISWLGFIIICLAVGSIFFPWLSIIAIVIAMIGKEYLNYKYRTTDQAKQPFFNQMEQGLKVLAVIPGTPADRLGILVGETIYRVNGQHIASVNEFYEALQHSGAYFRLEVIDDQDEVRFVQSAFYDNDHHELGLVFTEQPYRYEQTEIS